MFINFNKSMDCIKKRSSSFKISSTPYGFKKPLNELMAETSNESSIYDLYYKTSPRPCNVCGDVDNLDKAPYNNGSTRFLTVMCGKCMENSKLRASSSGESL